MYTITHTSFCFLILVSGHGRYPLATRQLTGSTRQSQSGSVILVSFCSRRKTYGIFLIFLSDPKKKKDTAQLYKNEAEAGLAIRDSGLERQDIFIATKYGGMDGLDIETSIQNSLKNVCNYYFSPLFCKN